MGKKQKYPNLGGEEFFEPSSKHFSKVPCMVLVKPGLVIGTVWEIGYGNYFIAPGVSEPDQDSAEYLGRMDIVSDFNIKEAPKLKFSLVVPSITPKYKYEKVKIFGEDCFKILSEAVELRKKHMKKMMHMTYYLNCEGVTIDSPSRYFLKVPRFVWSKNGLAIQTIWEMGCGKMFLGQGTTEPEPNSAEELGNFFWDVLENIWKFELTILDNPKEKFTIHGKNFGSVVGLALVLRNKQRLEREKK